MYEAGRIKVEQQVRVASEVRAFDISIGNGCLDYHYGLLIRVGFNANIARDGEVDSGSRFPFLNTSTAQIVYLNIDTVVEPKNIKVVVEN